MEKSWNLINLHKIMEKPWNFAKMYHGKIMENFTCQDINFSIQYVSDQHIFSCNNIVSVRMHVNRASWKMSSQAGKIMEKSWNFVFKSVWSPCNSFLTNSWSPLSIQNYFYVLKYTNNFKATGGHMNIPRWRLVAILKTK